MNKQEILEYYKEYLNAPHERQHRCPCEKCVTHFEANPPGPSFFGANALDLNRFVKGADGRIGLAAFLDGARCATASVSASMFSVLKTCSPPSPRIETLSPVDGATSTSTGAIRVNSSIKVRSGWASICAVKNSPVVTSMRANPALPSWWRRALSFFR